MDGLPREAISSVPSLRLPGAEEILIEALLADPPRLRFDAVEAATVLPKEKAIAVLSAAQKNSNPEVVLAAMTQLKVLQAGDSTTP